MKTLKSIIVAALCAVGMAAFAEPQTIDGSGVTWELTDGNTVLTIGGSGAMPDFKIAEGLYAPWYSERETITTVKIGSGVTRIGSFAFYDCQTMASVTIPSSVTSIGTYAFHFCTGVAELRIDSIESWCKVSIESEAVAGPFVFSTVSEKKLYVGGADVPTTALVIPDGVKTVNTYAFCHFDMLTSVTIPSSVERIRANVFCDCTGLTSVTISEGVTNFGDNAFTLCTGLTSVTIPSSVEDIGNSTFFGCSGLTSVTMHEGLLSIADGAFQLCSNLTSVTIPASVTNIWARAFYGCSGLASVTIPSSVTSIGSSAFQECTALTSVTIPSGVENIGNNAFNGCSGFTSVTIPSSVTNIGMNAFSSCPALKYIVEMREQPPTAGTRIFGFPQTFKGTIYVSPTSVDTYKGKDGWEPYKDFIKSWLPTVEYLDWDDEKKEMCSVTCMAYDVVTADTATFEAGKTYVVTNDVINASVPLGITVEGTEATPARLILCDGAKLTVTGQSSAETAGLNVSNGTAIVICGQKGGTGVLEATGGAGAAGIGGNSGQAAGTVTIYGGSVTALGKIGAAGIGGGMNKTDTGTVTFGAKFNVLAGNDAGSAQPIAQDGYAADHSATYVHIEPATVAQFVKGGEVVAKFATAEAAVAALDDAQYADIDEFCIGLTEDAVFDFGGRTNRVVILNVGAGTNTLKNVLLDCDGDYVVTGLVGTVVFGDGVRIEKETGFKQGLVNLIIKCGLYKSDPSFYCEDGSFGARRSDADAALNGLYAILPEAEIAVTVSPKKFVTTHYATLQDAFNLAIGENEEVTLRLFNNLELGTAVTKLEGNKFIRLLPSEAGANTITRVGTEPVIEIGREAKLEISDVIFDGANITSEKPMIEVAGKAGTKFGWLIAGDGFVVSNAVGGAVHVGSGGKFELNGVAKIIDNTTGGKPKNVIIEDSAAIQLTACGAVTDGNYAQIGVWSETVKFMVAGGQFGTVNTSYEYATDFADGDISVANPWVGFINDLDGSLHHAAGAKIAAAPTTAKKTYKRWVGGEYKETLAEGDHLVSREKSIVSVSPELIWTARQEAPAAQPAPAVLDWTDTTITLAVSNGCDYALVTSGSAETNWVSMVGTVNSYEFARPAGDLVCLRRYSITPSNIVSAATAYNVKIPAGTEGDPWLVGAENPEDVTAWTNGNEFVVSGDGTVSDLSKLASKVTVESLKISNDRVTGAEEDAFTGFQNVGLTLPDGWRGELPDEDGNWYGATGVTLAAVPLAVKNVTFLQRYPWNGFVDVSCDLTGEGEVTLKVTALTNDVKFVDAPTITGETTIDLDAAGGVRNDVKFIWNAAADLPAGFKAQNVKVKVTVEK